MITSDQIGAIAATLERQGLDEPAVSSLRAAYPAMHFTYCMDGDVSGAEPVMEAAHFRIYLVDAREHYTEIWNGACSASRRRQRARAAHCARR